MTLSEKIQKDLVDAMKSKDELRLSVLRGIKSAIQYKETEKIRAIDNLARINDSYGFDIADQVIAAVAKRVHSRMRGKDTLGRYSGNKFGLVPEHVSLIARKNEVRRLREVPARTRDQR